MSQVVEKPVTDAVLVGAGIMSATLGTLLRKLEPDFTVQVFERLDAAAAESSDAWNNAGTGHSAFCELNYTPEAADGSVDVAKAIQICEQFELSKQFWSALVEAGNLPDPTNFIRKIPHMSFVWGAGNASYLKTRHRALLRSPLFAGMDYSEDACQIAEWIPLVMEGREPSSAVAATRMSIGNDVNFGALTRTLVNGLGSEPGAEVHLNHEVVDIRREGDLWCVHVRDLETSEERAVRARFVFIGAGGGTLPLLEQTGIPEARGYGGFPVSGQWLRCANRKVVERHGSKVYGKAALGAPPMSVPHLDTRYIDGKKQLLFGPYAGFTTKFLKKGSFSDLFRSLGFDNIVPMMSAGVHNLDLTRYLVGQALLPQERRMEMLRAYYPSAANEDWELQIAGLRVQIIKGNGRGGGELKFGTEVVTSADGSLAALLGASPGASTAVAIMLELVQRCFPEQLESSSWQGTMRGLFPSYGMSLNEDPELCRNVRNRSLSRLSLQ